jgi:hypothetical protein
MLKAGMSMRRLAAVLALIVALGVPLASAGHHHDTGRFQLDCALCLATHFSPGTTVSAALPAALVVAQPAPAPVRLLAVDTYDLPTHPGRAPPALAVGTIS